jgi:hypothetical protein
LLCTAQRYFKKRQIDRVGKWLSGPGARGHRLLQTQERQKRFTSFRRNGQAGPGQDFPILRLDAIVERKAQPTVH